MIEPVSARPKFFALRGALGPVALCVGLACGAAAFYRDGLPQLAGILGLLSFGFALLTVTHLSSNLLVDKMGVRLKSAFTTRRLAWNQIKTVEISSVRASSPFVDADLEKTLSFCDAEGNAISINLTMWHGYAEVEAAVAERRFGGTYRLKGIAAKAGG